MGPGGQVDAGGLACRLAERVKELTLLHAVSRLLQGARTPDASLLDALAARVGPAWQFPDLCEVRIRWLHLEARTPSWSETPWSLRATLGAPEPRGTIEVAYVREPPSSPAFLDEEHELLASVAEMIGASFERMRAEALLRDREARLSFLYDLSEATRDATEVDDVLAIVVERLGRALRASRCAVVHVEDEGRRCWIPHDYTDGCPSLVGPYQMTAVGAEMLRASDRPIVVRDVAAELPPEPAAKQLGLGVRAMIVAAHVRDGSIRSLVAVQQTVPRDWTEEEVLLVSETVIRTWAYIEQRFAEAKLQGNEWLLRIAGEAARVGGWSIQLPDRRMRWSAEVCAIHDVPAGTTPTREQALEHYPPEHRQEIAGALDACFRDGSPFDLELPIVSAKGRRLWVRAIGRAERTPTGDIVGVQGAFQDVTERRALEAHLRQAQKMEAVGQLAAGVAHDFNNMLAVILSYAEILEGELPQGHALRAEVGEIQRAARRATDLTRQLLTFSRQQVLAPRRCDLLEIVQGIEAMLRRLVGDRIELRISRQPAAGEVYVDAGQVEQVLVNLVVNARDAMPDGGTLTLEVRDVALEETRIDGHEIAPGRYVMLAVADTGQGMDAATRARIFEPFFTTKQKGRGTGLGLATAYGVVTQSGGSIHVASEPGVGTTFRLYFPRVET